MVSAGNRASTSFKQLNPNEASQSRDALAKALYPLVFILFLLYSNYLMLIRYGALFDWIVKFLNVKLAKNDSEKLVTIGVSLY